MILGLLCLLFTYTFYLLLVYKLYLFLSSVEKIMLNSRTRLLRVKRNTVNPTVYEILFLLIVFLNLFLRNGIMEENMIYSTNYDVNFVEKK